MNIDTDTKTDKAVTKKENAKAAQRRHYEKVKKLKTLEKQAMQRIWDEFSEKEDPDAIGLVHIDNTRKLIECILLAIDKIEWEFRKHNGNVEWICYDWLRNKKLWTGKYVSKQDVFDGKFQRKIVPETVLIQEYFQFDDGSDKDDPLYDGFSNMIHHLCEFVRTIKEYDTEVMFVNLVMRNELTKMHSEESKTENTCKDITY